MTTYFFLDGIEKYEVPGKFLFGLFQFSGQFGEDEPADAVVQGSADEFLAVHQHGTIAIDADVADPQAHFFHFLGRRCSDIDKDIPCFRDGILAATQVDSRVACNPDDFSLSPHETDAPSAGDGDVGATHAFDSEEAFRCNVADHEADFVGMCFNHEGRSLGVFREEFGPGAAVGIAFDFIRVLFQFLRPYFLCFEFKPGRARRFQQFRQKLHTFIIHNKMGGCSRETLEGDPKGTYRIFSSCRQGMNVEYCAE